MKTKPTREQLKVRKSFKSSNPWLNLKEKKDNSWTLGAKKLTKKREVYLATITDTQKILLGYFRLTWTGRWLISGDQIYLDDGDQGIFLGVNPRARKFPLVYKRHAGGEIASTSDKAVRTIILCED